MAQNNEKQLDLFGESSNPPKPIKQERRDNELEWNQFIQLGEMIGDGLHHEPDGKWITRDYKRLAKILIPEIKEAEKERRKARANNRSEQISKLIIDKKCTNCGGDLVQKRKGTLIVYCDKCNSRFKAVTRKSK
jgi:ribosomal protein L37AE/L43A